MQRAEIERMLRDVYAARQREDAGGVLAAFAEDATFRIVANERLGDLGRQLQGSGEIREAFRHLFAVWDWRDFPVQAVLVDTGTEPAHAAVHSKGTMVHVPTGRRLELETLDILTLEDGRITSFRQFADTDLVVNMIPEMVVARS